MPSFYNIVLLKERKRRGHQCMPFMVPSPVGYLRSKRKQNAANFTFRKELNTH